MLTGLQLQGTPEIYTRDRVTISDHLYELESSANSKHNEKVRVGVALCPTFC